MSVDLNPSVINLSVNGVAVSADPVHTTLLELLREQLRILSVKDGCAPQGQCGCCTVLVDGQPRVACVTPLRRLAGRQVTTVEGLPPEVQTRWSEAFSACGASQCGFCSPGIVVRLVAEAAKANPQPAQALLAHVCRCTGWLPIQAAFTHATASPVALPPTRDAPPTLAEPAPTDAPIPPSAPVTPVAPAPAPDARVLSDGSVTAGSAVVLDERVPAAGGVASTPPVPADVRVAAAGVGASDVQVAAAALGASDVRVAAAGLGESDRGAARRAELEAHVAQIVGPGVALGRGGFAEDLAPADALVAVPDGAGGWAVGESLGLALQAAGKVQGRRSTVEAGPPVALPEGRWDRVLQTSWVDPAYLETDGSWCLPGGEPAHPAGNGGDFGAKADSPVAQVARDLANRYGRPVRVRFTREDTIRFGGKRPPLAAGIDLSARRVVIHVARTPGVAAALCAGLDAGLDAGPGDDHGFEVDIHEIDLPGPPTSLAPRRAGWAEGVVLRAALLGEAGPVRQPDGGWARARVLIDEHGRPVIDAEVAAGAPLAEAVLGSYCIGAVHMALSWVTSERVNVDLDGQPLDLTLRSLGVLRAVDMPPVSIRQVAPQGPPLAVSDALFAATAAAVWAHQGWPPQWPTRRPLSVPQP